MSFLGGRIHNSCRSPELRGRAARITYRPTSGNNPCDFVITFIHLLMFGPCRDEGEISRRELLPLFSMVRYDGSVTASSIDYGVLLPVMMYGGGGMWMGYHNCLSGEKFEV